MVGQLLPNINEILQCATLLRRRFRPTKQDPTVLLSMKGLQGQGLADFILFAAACRPPLATRHFFKPAS
jgi:hypothetical protein